MAFSSAELQALGDILNRYKFVIPDYQRGYAWQESQWEMLWQDLEFVGKSDSHQHFTGILLLKPLKNEGASVEVVDGQQRLITFMTLCNVLRSKTNQKLKQYNLKFIDNEDLQNSYDVYAMGEISKAARLSPNPSSYAQNIKDARDFFDEKIKQSSLSITELEEKLKLLLTGFRLFILEVAEGFDINVAFETLNNRGRKLSHMELLKNRLIYLTSHLELSQATTEDLRRSIHSAWKGIYRSLGHSKKTQNHDDEFLLAHSTAYFKKSRVAEWLDLILLKETFSISNQNLNEKFIRDYFASLEFCARWWSHIHEPSRLPVTHQKVLDRISRAGFAYFKPLILAAYMRITTDHPEASVSPMEHENELAPAIKLLEQIERFIVLIFRLLGKNASLGRADMEGAAYVLLMQGRKWKDGFDIEKMTHADAIKFVSDFIAAWIDNKEISDRSFTDERFKWKGMMNTNDVVSAINSRFEYQNGFYNWDFSKLVLFEYEESCREDGNPVKVPWEKCSFDETVEHIYPQTPSGIEYWERKIAIDGRSDRNEKVSKALQNSIGNLLLLPRSTNSSIRNFGYIESDGKGKRERFSNGSYSAVEVAKRFSDWDAVNIAQRGIWIFKFIEKRWGCTLTDDPFNPSSYLPLCFGPEYVKIKDGKAVRKFTKGKLNLQKK